MTPQNILFVTQVSCIFIVVCSAIYNLTMDHGDQHLWTMILTSSLAFLMPNPKFKTADSTPELHKVTPVKDVKEDIDHQQQQLR